MIPTNFCGVFVGQYVGGENDRPPLVLVLATSSQRTFGCFSSKRGSIVFGRNVGGDGLMLTEINCFDQRWRREYAFRFDGRSLIGASSEGPVFLVLDSDVPCSRFVGDAAPDESLRDFCLPVNPCNWVLARFSDGELFGAGFFDDSADVPGKAVLLFSLFGDQTADEGVSLTKIYENGSEFSVVYKSDEKGDLFDGRRSWGGTWTNACAGSFGVFKVSKASVGNQTVVICSSCSRLIEPGVPRWRGKNAENRESLCEFCRPAGDEFSPDLYEMDSRVMDDCTRDLTLKAFAAFSSRICLGWFDSFGKLETKTYADVFADVMTKSPKMDAAPVAICGPTNYTSCILMLSALLQDVAFISLESTQLALQVCPQATRVFDTSHPLVASSWTVSTSPRKKTDTVCFLSTSGTSGIIPKLARFAESLILPQEGLAETSPFVRADVVKFDPSFLPSLIQTLSLGGSRYFCTPDFQCLQVCRPTHLGAPPLFWRMLDRAPIDDDLKRLVGGRLKVCTSGGAALDRGTWI